MLLITSTHYHYTRLFQTRSCCCCHCTRPLCTRSQPCLHPPLLDAKFSSSALAFCVSTLAFPAFLTLTLTLTWLFRYLFDLHSLSNLFSTISLLFNHPHTLAFAVHLGSHNSLRTTNHLGTR